MSSLFICDGNDSAPWDHKTAKAVAGNRATAIPSCRFRPGTTFTAYTASCLVSPVSGTAARPSPQANTRQEERGTSQNINSGSTWLVLEVRRSVDERGGSHDNA